MKDYLVKKRSVDAAAITIEGHGVEARDPNPPGDIGGRVDAVGDQQDPR